MTISKTLAVLSLASLSLSGPAAAAPAAPPIPRGTEIRVNTNTTVSHFLPRVAVFPDGGFVVVWTDLDGRDGDGKGVYGRAFAANGTPRTGDFRLNTTTAGDQYAPAIAAARQGPVVVAWTQQAVEDGRSDVFVRVLSATP